MNILLTNDDGITAPGIAALYKELIKLGSVTVAAPTDGMSGAGHSITVFEPLECDEVKVEKTFTGYSVSGSPADCVKLAIMELCPEKPDLVVSGMNHGANVGINVYYSGTVGAAMEAAFYNIPAIAVSAAHEEKVNFAEAAKHARQTIEKLLPPVHQGVININIPRLSFGTPIGIKVVPQSTTGFEEHYKKKVNKKGKILYQLSGGGGLEKDSATDSLALFEGFITLTALGCDMTDYKNTERLHQIFL